MRGIEGTLLSDGVKIFIHRLGGDSMRSFTLFLALLLSCVILCASCAKKSASDPKDSFRTFQVALSDKDFSSAWDMLSSSSKKKFEKNFFEETKKEITTLPDAKRKEAQPVLGKTGDEILRMKTKDFFVLLMQDTEAGKEFSEKAHCEVESVAISGATAKMKIKDQKDEVTMVKESNAWKVEL
jgi:hypothetical protein